MFIYCHSPHRFAKFPIKCQRDAKQYDVFDSDLFWETVRAWSTDNLVVVS